MTWETFEKPAGRGSQRGVLVNRTYGTLRIGRLELEAIGSPRRVHLLYNADNQEVGIRAAADDDQFAYVVSVSLMVGFTGFLGHYKLDGLTGRRSCRVSEAKDMLVFSVAAAGETTP